MEKKTHTASLIIHRRDLRVEDNTALNEALKHSQKVSPCFIFDPRQVEKKNEYRSERAIAFMLSALEELEEAYRARGGAFSFFYGKAECVLEEILKKEKIDAVFIHADYTPFSRARDEALRAVCEKAGVAFYAYHDLLLIGDPEGVRTKSNTPYKVFTPFYRRAVETLRVAEPESFFEGGGNITSRALSGREKNALSRVRELLSKELGGNTLSARSEGLRILKKIGRFAEYERIRDSLKEDTTRLSIHHKFGTLSIRESYHALKKAFGSGSSLIRQLYWRDFFTQLSYYFPHIYGASFNSEYDAIDWEENNEHFSRWCRGETGYPLVDAGMRELNQTGYMHNRARMVVASFLTKDLHIDWRQGERYFAQKLIDYDPAVNNGSWQWSAGTGADAAPYFRIFNPWIQQKKFDPECVYIKRWIPELADIPASRIHAIAKKGKVVESSYPEPMCEHGVEATRAKALYKSALEKAGKEGT